MNMDRSKKIYIHIGTPKTGTSALQYFLLTNQSALEKRNVLYPDHALDNNLVSSGHNILVTTNRESEEKRKLLIDSICSSKKDVLLSSEFFMYHIEVIKELFPSATIILYLRRADLYTLSEYGQLVKRSSRTEELDTESIFDIYSTIVSHVEEVFRLFDKEQIIMRPYEEAQFYGGSIYSDFLNVIGIKEIDDFGQSERRINAGYTMDALEYKRILNRTLVDSRELDLELQEYSDNSFDTKDMTFMIPSRRQKEIIDRFSSFTNRVAIEYLNREDGILFLEECPDTNSSETLYEGLSMGKAEEITKEIYTNNPKIVELIAGEIIDQRERGFIYDDDELIRCILKGIEHIIPEAEYRTIEHKVKNINHAKGNERILREFTAKEILRDCIFQKDISKVTVLGEDIVLTAYGKDPIILLPELDIMDTNVSLEIDITAPSNTVLQVFYMTSASSHYCKENSKSLNIIAGRGVHCIDIDKFISGRLRIDPGATAGQYSIRCIKIRELNRQGSCSYLGGDRMKKVHVGSGPHNLMEGWINVDIRPFKGLDRMLDVTREWPFAEVDYIYGEHFIEHLPLKGAIVFLANAGASLKRDGVLRLTTPNLAWVVKTHYRLDKECSTAEKLQQTCAANRAFHGWGHHFLYDKYTLRHILQKLGYRDVVQCEYSESKHEALQGVERHGGFSVAEGEPNALIFEATKSGKTSIPQNMMDLFTDQFLKYVESGH